MASINREELSAMREDLAKWVSSNPRLSRRVAVEYHNLRIKVARTDVNEFIEFVMMDEKTGGPIYQDPMHEEFQALAAEHDRLILWAHVEGGKALDLKTPIPTPHGWTTMGELTLGSEVLDSQGQPCRVTFVTPTMHDHVVYRVRFQDGAEILADAEHQWWAWDPRAPNSTMPRVVTTATMRRGGPWKIPVTKPVQFSPRPHTEMLPIHPYAMGWWCVRQFHNPDPKLGAVLGVVTKIPDAYMRASEKDRRLFVSGMLARATFDQGGAVAFDHHGLAQDALEMVRSLGYLGAVSFVHDQWVLAFRGYVDHAGKEVVRVIESVTETESVPVRCIQVDSPDHSYLCGRDFTVTHNTTQLGVGRTLWELGRDPNMRIAVISSSSKNQSSRIVDSMKNYIEKSRRLREVFPHLIPGSTWSSGTFTVQRPTYSKDPTVQSTSLGTSSLTGSRLDRIIIDDLLTFDNTRTEEQREHAYNWLMSSTVMGRISAEGRVLFLGNAFHPKDAMHRFAANPGWVFARFPVFDEHGNPAWPDRWPLHRIMKRKGELHPDEFARQLLCIARDDAAGRFKREWIHACMDRGKGKLFAHQLNSLPPGFAVFSGVDLGVGKKKTSALTSFFTIVVHPNGDREVVMIEAGRWAGQEIISRVIDTHQRYGSVVYVESNGAQKYIVDIAKDQSAVPVKPLFTGKNKTHPDFGIEGMATEMSNGKWIIPSYGDHQSYPEVMAWADELVYFDPQQHPGDRLMSSWIARQGAKEWEKRPKMRTGRMDLQSR